MLSIQNLIWRRNLTHLTIGNSQSSSAVVQKQVANDNKSNLVKMWENLHFTLLQLDRKGATVCMIILSYQLSKCYEGIQLLNWNTCKLWNCREPMWPCLSIPSCVNWSWKSDFAYWITVMCLRYYEMGFLPMLKETADVSVLLWYEKFNLKGWEKEWCMAYFHSPTPGDMRMMFCCVQEMMPIVLQRNSFIIQFNFF